MSPTAPYADQEPLFAFGKYAALVILGYILYYPESIIFSRVFPAKCSRVFPAKCKDVP